MWTSQTSSDASGLTVILFLFLPRSPLFSWVIMPITCKRGLVLASSTPSDHLCCADCYFTFALVYFWTFFAGAILLWLRIQCCGCGTYVDSDTVVYDMTWQSIVCNVKHCCTTLVGSRLCAGDDIATITNGRCPVLYCESMVIQRIVQARRGCTN